MGLDDVLVAESKFGLWVALWLVILAVAGQSLTGVLQPANAVAAGAAVATVGVGAVGVLFRT
jgi:hypothetical protein